MFPGDVSDTCLRQTPHNCPAANWTRGEENWPSWLCISSSEFEDDGLDCFGDSTHIDAWKYIFGSLGAFIDNTCFPTAPVRLALFWSRKKCNNFLMWSTCRCLILYHLILVSFHPGSYNISSFVIKRWLLHKPIPLLEIVQVLNLTLLEVSIQSFFVIRDEFHVELITGVSF